MLMDAGDRKIAGLIRRCLTSRYVLRSRGGATFTSLAAHQPGLNAYFAKMGAELVIQEDIGIAYLEPVAEFEESCEFKLGRTVTLGSWETLLLIFLRQLRLEHFSGDVTAEVPIVSREKLREFASQFSTEKEDRKFQLRFEKALKELRGHQALLPVDDETRFEVSPVCDLLLPAGRIVELRQAAEKYFSSMDRIQEGEDR